MATSTYYADNANDAYAYSSSNATYSSTDSYSDASGGDTLYVGNWLNGGNYTRWMSYTIFDMTNPASGSAIPAGATINSVAFSVYSTAGIWWVTGEDIEVYRYDWYSDDTYVTNTDYRTSTQVAAMYSSPGMLCSYAAQVDENLRSGNFTENGTVFRTAVANAIGGSLPIYLTTTGHRTNTGTAAESYTRYAIASSANATQANHIKMVVDYTAAAVPTVTGLSKTRGSTAGGTEVTITGTGFTGITGADGVKFGTTNATSYTVDSGTSISAVAPAHAAGNVYVYVGASTDADGDNTFTYISPLGKTSLGTAASNQANSLYGYANRWHMTEGGLVSSMSAYVGGAGAGGTSGFRIGIWADSGSNTPGTLLRYTAYSQVTSAQSAGWVTLALTSPLQIFHGSYWFGYIWGATDARAYLWREAGTGCAASETDYANACYTANQELEPAENTPATTWPTTNSYTDRVYAIYATYEPTAGAITATSVVQFGIG